MPKIDRPQSEATPENVKRREIKWDAMAAIIASCVGLLALVVAGYTAYIARYTANIQLKQVQAQVWPFVLIGRSDAQGHAGIMIFNKGVGPAIIRSVQVLADGKPVANWNALMLLFGFKSTGDTASNTLYANVLTPEQQLDWIVFQKPSDFHSLWADWERFHVEVRVCYSSTLGESWLLINSGAGNRHEETASCPGLPDSAQFHG